MTTMLRRRLDAEIDPERLRHPALAPDVVVHEPIDGDGAWFLQRGGRQYFAVTEPLAKLASALDGVRDPHALARELGPPWQPADVEKAIGTLARSALIDDGTKRRRSGWIRFVPPLTVQVKLVDPARVLARLAPAFRWIGHRAVVVAAALVVGVGVLAMVVQGQQVSAALGRPLPVAAYLFVAAALFLTTVAHEVAHGATLTFHGGRPNRMGFMLFYLAPAFFCDVSDGWRLPHRHQRVQVALAGVATQFFVGGATASVAGFIGNPDLRDAAFVFAVASYVSGLLNLLPFVKLDGYIALMCHLDISHLRDKALLDARRFLARLLFGARPAPALPQLRWAVAYGLACMVFPVYLIIHAMVLWVDIAARLGMVGAGLLLVAGGYLLYLIVRGFVRLVREGRAGGARWWRIGLGLLLAGAAAAAAFAFVRLPATVQGGFVTGPQGRLTLVLPDNTPPDRIDAGATVVLYRVGLVTRAEIGSATVASATPSNGLAPLSAFVPMRLDAAVVPAQQYPLTPITVPTDQVGAAEVRIGTLPLAAWLYDRYVAPVLSR